jgi:hypothetical protein
MARRKSSHRARRTKHTRRRHTRRVRRTRRGGSNTPYPATRMIPLPPNNTLDGRYFSRANQIGGGLIPPGGGGGIGRHGGGTLQPSGTSMVVGGSNGQMKSFLVTGGRA